METEIEKMVRKRGNAWCVLHGHPKKPGSPRDKPRGTVIHCYKFTPGSPGSEANAKRKAHALHRAIMASKTRRAAQKDEAADFAEQIGLVEVLIAQGLLKQDEAVETQPEPPVHSPRDVNRKYEMPNIDWLLGFGILSKAVVGKTILDVGCGAGFGIGILRSSGFMVDGIDIDESAVKYCNDFGYCVMQGTAESLPFDDGNYDTVLSMHVLEHTTSPLRALREMTRVAALKSVHIISIGKRTDSNCKHAWESVEHVKSMFSGFDAAILFVNGEQCLIEISKYKSLPHVAKVFRSIADFVVVPDFVSLVGSTVKNDFEGPRDNIDMLVRVEEEGASKIAASTELQVINQIPESAQKRIRVIHSAMGPHATYLPLYDLVLRRKQDLEVVEIKAEDIVRQIKLMKWFQPLKPVLSEKVWEKLEKGWLQERIKSGVVVQQKFDGYRMIIHKRGDEVKMFSDDPYESKDIERFPGCIAELKSRFRKDVILDAEMFVFDKSGQPLGREALINVLETGNPHDDNVVFFVSDVLWANGSSQENVPLIKRLEGLRQKLPTGMRHFRMVAAELCVTVDQVLAAVKKVRGGLGSEGALLREAESKYSLAGFTTEWAKIGMVHEIVTQIMRSVPIRLKGDPTLFSNYCGIIGRKGELQEVGSTMNTAISAKVGDLINVRVLKMWHSDSKKRYYWVMAKVQAVRRDRTKPATAQEADCIVAATSSMNVEKSVTERQMWLDDLHETMPADRMIAGAILQKALCRGKAEE